ncbi:hypothetical protein [Metaclostridioides mangenotii]|uniref:hypothetical protein n=1 Tax=Metaclostridioides mangenotii TaxID=1540 RepID=UPI00068C57C5|nr:hypothetical protein [Clostridioides mangenotii]
MFDILLEAHEMIEESLISSLSEYREKFITVDEMTNIIFYHPKLTNETPILKLLTTGEIDLLISKLPKEVVEAHLTYDKTNIKDILNIFLNIKKDVDPNVLSSAFKSLFITMLHKREIGKKEYYKSLKMLTKGLVIQILG